MPKGLGSCMRSRRLISVISCFIIAGVALALFWQYGFSDVSRGFACEVRGEVLDKLQFGNVDVSLSLRGIENEKWSRVTRLSVEGGTLEIEDYGTFSVSRGDGILVYRYHFVFLTVMVSDVYGGQSERLQLRGRIGTLSGNELSVSLYSSTVILPLRGVPRLYGLWLTGTITLD